MDIALMIEGQMGLNWPRWRMISRAAEQLGFAGLYRSDHYTGPAPPDQDSLELWVSLTWLAENSQRIEFGPLVTPLSFRDASMTARMASAVDDLSGGRLQLGLGAGWMAREHEDWGWDLLDFPERFERFQDGLEIITRLMSSDEPVSHAGKYYHTNEARMLPRPARPGGPPVVIGGTGKKYTLPLAARYAQEWNCLARPPQVFSELSRQLDTLIEEHGRRPHDVRRSMMAATEYGENERDLKRRTAARFGEQYSIQDLRGYGLLVGTGSQLVDQLGRLAEAGVQRVMLQWLELDDTDRLEKMAGQVLPHFPKG